MDRATRCFLGWKIVWERTRDDLQAVMDDGPKAKWYFSDAFESYASLWFHFGRYEVSEGKSETYSVEADNAELRHHLARLPRSSQCFSRCPYALHCCAIRLFVYCYNHCQSTAANSRATPFTSWTSLGHYFWHSPILYPLVFL
jgi:IS1 family transposase